MYHYTVYKITNTINEKIYIGVHKTTDLNDDYMGSGLNIRRAIEKYGVENFNKEILFSYDNQKDMFDKERELVNEEFISRPDTYNIALGGNGSWMHVNEHNKKFTKGCYREGFYKELAEKSSGNFKNNITFQRVNTKS